MECNEKNCHNAAEVIVETSIHGEVVLCGDCFEKHQNDYNLRFVEFVDQRQERIMQDKMMGGRW